MIAKPEESQFQTRPYAPEYFERIRQLWKETYNEKQIEQRAALFAWLTQANPWGRNSYYVLFDHDRIVGMLGHMPVEFAVHGQRQRGNFSHDILLAQAYRGKGLGAILVTGVMQQSAEPAGAIWFNEPNHRMYMKTGWVNAEGFYPYVLVFDPGAFIRNRIRSRIPAEMLAFSAKLVFAALNRALFARQSLAAKRVDIEEIVSFPNEMRAFFDRISGRLGIIVERDAAYLNWKFTAKPFNNYRRFMVRDQDGLPAGYMVLRREAKGGAVRGRIVDILADPLQPKIFRALLSHAILFFKQSGATHVEIICTLPPFIKEMKRFGFIRSRRSRQPFMVMHWEDRLPRDFVVDSHNWYLTFGDADGDAWEVDDPGQ
jgi:GNAT superfamily N-acetyltransferase